jgi:protein TonB
MRLQTKCMFGSAAIHTLLLVALLVGSAFVPPKPKEAPLPVFKMFKVTDDVTMGNGIAAPESRISKPAPAPAPTPAPIQKVTPTPPAPAPVEVKPVEKKQETKPERKPEVKPEPVKPPVTTKNVTIKEPPKKPVVKNPEAPKIVAEKKPEPQRHEIVPDLTTVTKPDPKIAEQKAERRRQQQEQDRQRQAEAKRKYDEAMVAYLKSLSEANAKAQRDAADRLQAMNRINDTLGNSLSGTSSLVTMPEPGGEAFVNYSQLIWSKYYDAWRPPSERSQNATVRVRIVISKDGRVISAQVIGRSGDVGLDKSVREALDRVRLFPPFPEGAKDSERTFNIEFSLKAKRLIG